MDLNELLLLLVVVFVFVWGDQRRVVILATGRTERRRILLLIRDLSATPGASIVTAAVLGAIATRASGDLGAQCNHSTRGSKEDASARASLDDDDGLCGHVCTNTQMR